MMRSNPGLRPSASSIVWKVPRRSDKGFGSRRGYLPTSRMFAVAHQGQPASPSDCHVLQQLRAPAPTCFCQRRLFDRRMIRRPAFAFLMLCPGSSGDFLGPDLWHTLARGRPFCDDLHSPRGLASASIKNEITTSRRNGGARRQRMGARVAVDQCQNAGLVNSPMKPVRHPASAPGTALDAKFCGSPSVLLGCASGA